MKRIFSCQSVNVLVNAPKKLIKRIEFLSKEYFTVSMEKNIGSWEISVLEAKDIKGYEKVCIHAEGEPECNLFINGNDRKIIFIMNDNNQEWLIQNIHRMIRVLLRMQCIEKGHLFMHGGLVNYRGYGIAFLGGKKAGKTSSILSMLSLMDSVFVSNDDISFFENDNVWMAQGWPRSIVVREDTLEKVCGRKKNTFVHELHHPLNSSNKLICFYPDEFVNIFNRKLSSESILSGIIFPSFSNDVNMSYFRQLNEEEAEKFVIENILINPAKYNEFLFEFFQLKNIDSYYKQIKRLIHQIPCYELVQSFENLKESSIIIKNFIDNLKL